MTGGTLVIGLLNGLTIGVLAVGLVLVYKANRFLNLAHAQLGALPAVLLAKAVQDWNIPFAVSLVGAVALGAAVAVVAERAVIAPVRAASASPLRLLLLTIGLSQVLLALTYVPWVSPDPVRQLPYPQPFSGTVSIGGVVLQGMDILTIVLVPIVVAGLAGFLRFSTMGKQIRAAANNPDAARTCGISVARVSTVTWAVAGALAALSAVLVAPGLSSARGASLGPGLLLVTLGAAALGAFVSIPTALAGGLAIGLVGQAVTAETSSTGDGQLAVFLLIMGFILVRARQIAKVFAHTGGAVHERSIVRIPPSLSNLLVVKYQRAILGGLALALAVAMPFVPGFATEANRFRLVLLVMFCLLGVSLTMLLGWAGQVSLGHGFVVGVGAFITARLAPQDVSVPAIMLMAATVGAGVLVITGIPALRVPGFTLAVVTLGVAVVGSQWLFTQEWFVTDRPSQLSFDDPRLPRALGAVTDQLGTFYVALAALVLALAAASALRRSVPGRLILAVRDNEDAVASFGVAPASVKLAILAVSGALAGVAGVLWASAYGVANASQFTPDLSLAVLAIPVVGGTGSLAGAVAGALLLYVPSLFVAPHLGADGGAFGEFFEGVGFVLLVAGLGLIITIRTLPAGVAGVARAGWQRWLDRRARRVASHSPAVSDAPTADEVPIGLEIDLTPVAPPAVYLRMSERLVGEASSVLDTVPLFVENVSVRFGGITALDEAGIEVGQGEIVGLIGQNGAGKSTLMNVVSGNLRPDAGSVKLFGHEVGDLSPDLRAAFGLARTFQHASLFSGLTVVETIQVAASRRWMTRFGPALLGAPWSRWADALSEVEADNIVDRFGLSSWRDTLCSDLSTGTRRICDLAAQVATRPKLLLLDEPTGGVAQREAEAFGPLLREVRGELDCSILIVEHDMPLLMGLCDRVFAMKTGRVIAEGTPDEVRNDPMVIASYLGTSDVAINRSGADLTRSDA